jgi:hypothetical protein
MKDISTDVMNGMWGRDYTAGVAAALFGEVVGCRGDKAVALAGDGGDVAWVFPAILQLDPQIANMPINHITLGHVIGTPQMIQNLIAGQELPSMRCQQIQQALLNRCEV